MDEKRINIIVDSDFKKQVKIKAANEGKTITEIVVNYLKKWLKK